MHLKEREAVCCDWYVYIGLKQLKQSQFLAHKERERASVHQGKVCLLYRSGKSLLYTPGIANFWNEYLHCVYHDAWSSFKYETGWNIHHTRRKFISHQENSLESILYITLILVKHFLPYLYCTILSTDLCVHL